MHRGPVACGSPSAKGAMAYIMPKPPPPGLPAGHGAPWATAVSAPPSAPSAWPTNTQGPVAPAARAPC
eukprot:9293767-Lingulodinium_polyedra.AAC.1